MRRFFLKHNPKQKLWMSGQGQWLEFEFVDDDVGIFSTENTAVLAELDNAIKRGIGAIVEIDQQTYEEQLSQKKNWRDSPKVWREEYSLPHLNKDTITPASPPPPLAAEPVAEPAKTAAYTAMPRSDFRPNPRKNN